MKRSIGILTLVLVAVAAVYLGAYPTKSTLNWAQLIWGWSESEGAARPIACTATGSLEVNITGATVTASGSLEVLIPATVTASTTDLTSTSSSANVASLANRIWIGLQNHHATCSAWLAPGSANATVSSGIELKAGSYWGRPYGPGVNVPYVSSISVSLTADQESL